MGGILREGVGDIRGRLITVEREDYRESAGSISATTLENIGKSDMYLRIMHTVKPRSTAYVLRRKLFARL
jgi:hypothetical protein